MYTSGIFRERNAAYKIMTGKITLNGNEEFQLPADNDDIFSNGYKLRRALKMLSTKLSSRVMCTPNVVRHSTDINILLMGLFIIICTLDMTPQCTGIARGSC